MQVVLYWGRKNLSEDILTGKTVVLGVTGGIAAYKAAQLAGQLVKRGVRVRAVMTRNACKFIQPLTLSEITGYPAVVDMFAPRQASGIVHIDLAEDADVYMIAPATANIIGKMAAGIADDLVSTTYLATRAPVVLAPAMNSRMWAHVQVQENVKRLRSQGVLICGPASGRLACGDIGEGRLADYDDLMAAVEIAVAAGFGELVPCLEGLRVLVSAGGTREHLDPVRFLGNRSSGRMGYAIARVARFLGADVTLVSGPSSLTPPAGVRLVVTESAQQMHEAVIAEYATHDIAVMAAAVADYRPAIVSASKIKKGEGEMVLHLARTKDILADLGASRRHQVLVGFAAETENLLERAQRKLEAKGVQILIANDISQPEAGFAADTNKVIYIDQRGSVEHWPVLPKSVVAWRLLRKAVQFLQGSTQCQRSSKS